MAERAPERGNSERCPKCGSQTPIGHRCIVDDLDAIRNADLSDHPLMQAIKSAAPRDEKAHIAEVLRQHRVNYHHRNVGPEPVTSANLRYTSCEGCGWLGGHRDEQGWEQHVAAILATQWREETRPPSLDVGSRCPADMSGLHAFNPGDPACINCDERRP